MEFKVGQTLYLYTARNGKFNIHEGVVIENKKRYWTRLVVEFKTRSSFEFLPKDHEIGCVCAGGPRIWLLERDDALAKKLFLEYELELLAKLERQIAVKKELIKVLRE